VNLPEWLSHQLAAVGAQNAERAITRQEAVTRLRDTIIGNADRAFQLVIAADFAGRQLDAWHRQHSAGTRAPVEADGQSELFPGLAVRLMVRPGVRKAVILFTAHDWDTARAVMETRTTGAKKAAEADWEAFDAAYKRVRPLLHDELTTADIAPELDTQLDVPEAPEAPAVPEARFTTP
jgi:hypothetical protein